MTIVDAIELIKIAKAEIEWEYPLDYQIAFDEAIKALEKQIPHERVRRDKGYFRYECPKCENTLYVLMQSYCGNCGQAIDWSKEDLKDDIYGG